MSVPAGKITLMINPTFAAEMLAFERQWPRHRSAKEMAIRAAFDMPPARYYQVLDRVARSLEGWEADPMTCRRIVDRALDAEQRRRRLYAL